MQKHVWIMLILLSSVMLFSPQVASHGEAAAQHGGVLYNKYDLSFELVRASDAVSLYINDHDAPYATSGVQAQLLILATGQKKVLQLTAAGDGKFSASGAQIPDGAKVVLTVTTAQNDVMTLRYSF